MLYELGLILFQYFQILLCLCCFCCKKKNTDDLKPVKMKSKKSSPYPDDGYPVENLIVTQNPTNSNGAGSSGQPPNYQSIRHSLYIRTVRSYIIYICLQRATDNRFSVVNITEKLRCCQLHLGRFFLA
jgi:hypothetical protein